MTKWKEAVNYFKDEKVVIRMVLDFDIMEQISKSKFEQDALHCRNVLDFINESSENKKEYLDHVFTYCNVM